MAILSICVVFLIMMFTWDFPTLLDLQLFHSTDIQLYKRMVHKMRISPATARMVMSLWFCLEELGYHYLIESIFSCDDIVFRLVFEEALSCLKCIGPNPTVPGDWEDNLVMSTLVDESIKRRFIYFNRELIYARMNHFLNTICSVIFDNNPAMEFTTTLATPRAQADTFTGVESLATSRAQAENSMGVASHAVTRAHAETSVGIASRAISRDQAETSMGIASRAISRDQAGTSMGIASRAISRDQTETSVGVAGPAMPRAQAETCVRAADRASFRAQAQKSKLVASPAICKAQAGSFMRVASPAPRDQAESSMQGALRASRPSSSLDPHASPFYMNEIPPRDQRTMFITYSHGYPIPNEEVMAFFRKGWGDVVEDIEIDKKDGIINPEPEYSRLVFKNVSTIYLILNGQEKVKFNIKGRQLWARLYVSRKKRNSDHSKGKSI